MYNFRHETSLRVDSYLPLLVLLSASALSGFAQAGFTTDPEASSDVGDNSLSDPDSTTPTTSDVDEVSDDVLENPVSLPNELIDDADLMGSLDLLFGDFDVVISATRNAQSSNMAPVPVRILSADDIHYSGVSELPQLFAFVPGFDALQLDRNRWALGARGLHQTFSDRTLFLLNGRNASNPLHGGVDFQVLPVFLDDIEQIEVVFGPGGAAWGANAFNGVVNVIDKDPRDTTGVRFSQRISEHGDFKTNFRVGDSDEKFAWRLSAEFNDVDSSGSDYVIDPTGIAVGPDSANDFLHSQRYKFSGVYDFDGDTSLDFGIGASHVERGDSPFLALQLGIDERLDLLTAHAKLNKEFSPDASGYLQWYGTYQDVNRPSMYRYNSFDQSIDAQYNFDYSSDHKITLGATARMIHLNISEPRTTDSIPSGVRSEQWIGMFVGDQWTMNEKWTMESQLRLDWYSETMLDWSGRLAMIRSFDQDGDHVLRLALAKAFRTPQTALRELSSDRIPLGGGLSAVNLIPAGTIDNEEIYSAEIGYSGKLAQGLTLRADAYIQYYQDLTGIIELPEPAPTVGRLFFTVDNIGMAKAYGFETELKYTNDRLTASLWYTYNDFEYDLSNQNARAFAPAKNKVGSSLRYSATDWLTLNANYRYTDTTQDEYTKDVEAFHRLDLTASMRIEDLNAELQIGVLDVLDETSLLIFDQTATSIATETPGRTLFVQLHVDF
jgi:iron complex outermembrane recepter protein